MAVCNNSIGFVWFELCVVLYLLVVQRGISGAYSVLYLSCFSVIFISLDLLVIKVTVIVLVLCGVIQRLSKLTGKAGTTCRCVPGDILCFSSAPYFEGVRARAGYLVY